MRVSSGRASAMPTADSASPPMTAAGMAVWTVRRTFSASPAPMPCATMTPAPMDSPMNRLTIRFVTLPVAPTAATLRLPENCPTITRSAALNSSWSIPVRMIGIV